ncbi:hypothetical protein COT63_02105 [Candidatus Shapirobacteria bacterium CG09_land_8_20_14_0_10_38_17]|uniref:Uncharacterized protein n=1 Tax=Candidatus Shapirobacteria bacterium CG09_land_8_20_14_0_10_38_17 TaxID=1974884 RepID=A0A2H0WQU7_9BACT|nr:MAG: hypothetical protein COT63_02105 [Candidatus Shapirobacteria bacterium CG09_land_8_20_14_0_10_38_17]
MSRRWRDFRRITFNYLIPSFWLALALYQMVQGPESPSHRHPDENQDHLKKILNQVQNDDFSNVTM